jgi:ArsR family transcriptional regulator
MSKTAFEENLEARAELFKSLGHPTRLLILNLVAMRPRHGEELAAILKLKPATISFHLSKLTNVGLLNSRKDQYYQIYSLVGDPLKKTLGEVVELPQPGLMAGVEVDAYRKKVLRTFFKHGRLTQIPAQLKKWQVILEKLVEEFEPEHRYTELEVNRILLEFHEDVATLRRDLVDLGYMDRESGIYWRVIHPQSVEIENEEVTT